MEDTDVAKFLDLIPLRLIKSIVGLQDSLHMGHLQWETIQTSSKVKVELEWTLSDMNENSKDAGKSTKRPATPYTPVKAKQIKLEPMDIIKVKTEPVSPPLTNGCSINKVTQNCSNGKSNLISSYTTANSTQLTTIKPNSFLYGNLTATSAAKAEVTSASIVPQAEKTEGTSSFNSPPTAATNGNLSSKAKVYDMSAVIGPPTAYANVTSAFTSKSKDRSSSTDPLTHKAWGSSAWTAPPAPPKAKAEDITEVSMAPFIAKANDTPEPRASIAPQRAIAYVHPSTLNLDDIPVPLFQSTVTQNLAFTEDSFSDRVMRQTTAISTVESIDKKLTRKAQRCSKKTKKGSKKKKLELPTDDLLYIRLQPIVYFLNDGRVAIYGDVLGGVDYNKNKHNMAAYFLFAKRSSTSCRAVSLSDFKNFTTLDKEINKSETWQKYDKWVRGSSYYREALVECSSYNRAVRLATKSALSSATSRSSVKASTSHSTHQAKTPKATSTSKSKVTSSSKDRVMDNKNIDKCIKDNETSHQHYVVPPQKSPQKVKKTEAELSEKQSDISKTQSTSGIDTSTAFKFITLKDAMYYVQGGGIAVYGDTLGGGDYSANHYNVGAYFYFPSIYSMDCSVVPLSCYSSFVALDNLVTASMYESDISVKQHPCFLAALEKCRLYNKSLQCTDGLLQ